MSKRVLAPPHVLARYSACEINSQDVTAKIDSSPIGVSIGGWRITSSNSPISTEAQTKEFADFLAEHCNNKKKLSPPELLFYNAYLVLEFGSFKLQATARTALTEWAVAHLDLDENKCQEVRGVCIIKSADASLWEAKPQRSEITTPREFIVDWTWSTPYAFGIQGWTPLPSSGMDMDALRDQTLPILYYHDVTLYEDDLHDNGHVQLNIKIRVMPTCFLVLQRLVVRVEGVLARCRETRLFCHMNKPTHLYRDVSWRQATWDQLPSLGLTPDTLDASLNQLPLVELPFDLYAYSVKIIEP